MLGHFANELVSNSHPTKVRLQKYKSKIVWIGTISVFCACRMCPTKNGYKLKSGLPLSSWLVVSSISLISRLDLESTPFIGLLTWVYQYYMISHPWLKKQMSSSSLPSLVFLSTLAFSPRLKVNSSSWDGLWPLTASTWSMLWLMSSVKKMDKHVSDK